MVFCFLNPFSPTKLEICETCQFYKYTYTDGYVECDNGGNKG